MDRAAVGSRDSDCSEIAELEAICVWGSEAVSGFRGAWCWASSGYVYGK